jgi:chitinase
LIRARNSNKCLDVVGAATYNGARIQQWDCNGSPQQRWFMHMDSKGDYLIVNEGYSKPLKQPR